MSSHAEQPGLDGKIQRYGKRNRRIVTVTIVTDAPSWDDETVAANIADDLRDAGWQPVGITVLDPYNIMEALAGDAE